MEQKSTKVLNGTKVMHKTTGAFEDHAQWWYKFIPLSIISLFTAVFYYPSLRYPFQFDDLANITKKYEIRFCDFKALAFSNSRWLGEMLNGWNYNLGERFRFGGGGFEPFYYRVVNVSIHLLTGIVFFFLVHKICTINKTNSFLRKRALWIASFASTLFLLHPVQSQTVSYVIQARLEGLVCFFVLATILSFMYAITSKSTLSTVILYALGLGLGVVSCGTKEIVIVAPLLFALVDWFFIAQGDWNDFKSRLWLHITYLLIVVGSILFYLNRSNILSKFVGLRSHITNNRGNILTESPTDLIKPLHFLISEFKVVLHYLFIFFVPYGLSVEYDWKMSHSFLSPDSFFPFLILAGMALYSLNYLKKNPTSLPVFSLWWFLIAIAPRSTIIPSPELVCDYKTYLASAGIFLFMAAGLVWLMDKALEKIAEEDEAIRYVQRLTTVVACAAMLGAGTQWRNQTWETTVSFWQDIVVKAPKKARGHNNLGVALSEGGRYTEAIPHYLEAIRLDKYYSDPHSNIAVAYSVTGNDEKAIAALQEAVRIFPDYPEAHNNLGSLLLKKGEHALSEKALKNAVALRPYYGKGWFNMGRLYFEQEKFELAWDCFVKATKGDLDIPETFNILGQVALKLGKYPEAVEAFSQTRKRMGDQRAPQVEFNYANALYLSGNVKGARELFGELAQNFPNVTKFCYNYAESLLADGEPEKAHIEFSKIAQQTQDFPTAIVRAAHCLEKQGKISQAISYLSQSLDAKTTTTVQEIANQEIARLRIQEKMVEGNGSIRVSDLQNIANQAVQREQA